MIKENINVRMVGYVLAKPYHNQGITTGWLKLLWIMLLMFKS